jgi:anti-sigma regulatory factor (Ser/Thr protein kinase)
MRLKLTLPALAESVSIARRVFSVWAQFLALPEGGLEDMQLCLSEASANAIVHGSPASTSQVTVFAHVVRDVLVVEVCDEGRGFACLMPIPEPPLLVEHGRGLYLMQSLADGLDILSGGKGTTIRLTKRLCEQ